MKKLEIIIQPGKCEAVRKAMDKVGCAGMTISQAEGHGTQKGLAKVKLSGSYLMEMVPKTRIVAIVKDSDVETMIEAIIKEARTGQHGDGKIFISDINDAVRIRTGERGETAV
ncbi:MAG: P-II family nitrogen regulator [bacterium]